MQRRLISSLLADRYCYLLTLFLLGFAPTVFADDAPTSIPPTTAMSSETNGASLEALAVKELPSALHYSPETIDLTAPTEDLWKRLRNGFSMPGLNNELVLQHQLWFQNHPDYLRRVAERSRRYLHHIVEELERRGMPTELALLPMVESSFNPMAYSRAHASGLWQFIPATGKRYDLQQNWWHDQRRDIVASTNAALDYLQDVYDMHGDWHLALASYNWGEGAVKRAIQKNAAKGLPTDYSSLTMPAETRHYVPKLMALKNIFSNPALLAELNLPPMANRPYFATYEPMRPMDVKVAAKLAEMSVDEFVALNPAHNRPVINPATPLVIPADKLERFQSNLENHGAPLSSWQLYTLKSSEKLDKLAPKFGIALADLKRVNGLHGKIKIAAGSSLLVPARDGKELDELPLQLKVPEVVPERSVGKKKLKGGKSAKQQAKSSTTRKPAKRGASLAKNKTKAGASAKPRSKTTAKKRR